jgi:hypothetical protein
MQELEFSRGEVMKFTEHMQIFGIDSAPHAQLRAVIEHMQKCPDLSRKETARGEDARDVVAIACTEGQTEIEWINILTVCGEEAVVEFVRWQPRDPPKAPDPVIIEPDKRKIKIEVDGQ